MFVSALTDCLLEQVTVAGGNTPAGGETPVGSGSGGGVRVLASTLEMVDCVFSNNQGNASGNGYGWGGGLYSDSSTVAIRGTRFVNNRARNASGSNNARTLGGALAARGGGLTVMNCEFLNNDSDSYGHYGSYGGAIYTESTVGWIRNVLVAGNRAGPNRALGLGGGVYLTAGMVLENATVVSNRVWNPGTTAGGIYATGGAVTNSIVYLNENRTLSTASDAYSDEWSRFAHSCAPELPDGVNGNIVADPVFADPSAGDFRLRTGSPCWNAGVNRPWMVGAVDLAGVPRIMRGQVDMGAYETPPAPGTIFVVR